MLKSRKRKSEQEQKDENESEAKRSACGEVKAKARRGVSGEGAEEMRIRFLGGCGEVGRSAVLIDDKILLDYGVRPSDPPEIPIFSRQIAKSLEAVIVSHAHLDHSGMIPSLMNCNNNSLKLFMTPVTCDIAKILWRDTIKLGEEHGIHLFNGEMCIRRSRMPISCLSGSDFR